MLPCRHQIINLIHLAGCPVTNRNKFSVPLRRIKFASISVPLCRIPSIFLCRRMVRNGIPRVFCCSAEQSEFRSEITICFVHSAFPELFFCRTTNPKQYHISVPERSCVQTALFLLFLPYKKSVTISCFCSRVFLCT
jgi:hypothetical protein